MTDPRYSGPPERFVVAMLVYDYNRPISTATSPPLNPPSTTGSAPTPLSPTAPAPKSP
jgi:hypothetical protein